MGAPLTPQHAPTAAAQLPRRSLLPPGARPQLGPASGQREVRREEKDRETVGRGRGAGEGGSARASERGSKRGGPGEGSQWPGARRGRGRGRRPSGPAAPARQASPPRRSPSPRRNAWGLPTSAAGAVGLRLRAPAVWGRRESERGTGPGGRGPGPEAHGAQAPLARPPGARPLRHICSSGREGGRGGRAVRGCLREGGRREEGGKANPNFLFVMVMGCNL